MKPIVLRYPRSSWIYGISVLVLLGILQIGCAIGIGILLAEWADWEAGAIFVALSAFLWAMSKYVGRDALAKKRWQITIQSETIELKLPANRTFGYGEPPLHRTLARRDIAAIEHRLEAYSSIGLVNLQRSHVLLLKSGERIILGEDRGINSRIEDTTMLDNAAILSDTLGIRVKERAMVHGNGGILGMWLVRAPGWDARDLSSAETDRMHLRVAITELLPLIFWLAAVVLAAIFGDWNFDP